MRAGSGALETWSDDPRYAFSFLHGFARERSTGCNRWPNRPRPEVGGGRRSEKRGGQTKALNSRIDGLLATVSFGGRSCWITRLPAAPSIGVDFHKFSRRADIRE